MLNIATIQCNALAENCYIVNDETKECVIVDCGAVSPFEFQAIEKYIKDNDFKVVAHILTHGHFDHCMGSKWVVETFGIAPTVHERDAETYKNFKEDAANFGYTDMNFEQPALARCLNDGNEVSFGNTTFKVMHTPGHSKGSVVYYCEKEKAAFTGDTLFKGSIGRTDFKGGSMFQMIQSIRLLSQMPDDVAIYPGHGESSTIGYEGATNPYMEG